MARISVKKLRAKAKLSQEELPRFLLTPQPLLRSYRPVDLLESRYSFEDLLAFVESAKSGDMT